MKDRFHDLFMANRAARIKMYASAWLISTVVATYLMLTGTSLAESVDASCLLLLAILVSWTGIYCVMPLVARQRQPNYMPIFIGRRAVFAASIILAVAIALGVTTGKLEAAVVRRRLRKYAGGITQSDVDTVANTLDFARKNAVRVEPSLIAAIGSNLKHLEAENESTDAIVSLHRAVESAANLQSKLLARPPKANLQHYVRMPDHSVFDRSYVHDISFDLDTLAFMDSDVEDCIITYNGGSVFLKNTAFIRCEFNFSEAPEARELLLLFTQRNDPNFSYRAEEVFRGFR